MKNSGNNAKNPQDPAGRTQADAQLDATLQALNQVQPPARLEQRIHARLAQQAGAQHTVPFAEKLAAALSWQRAAFAAATFTAGAITAVLVGPIVHVPFLHGPVPAMQGVAAPSKAMPAPPAAAAPVNDANVHPAFTVRTPDGRAAAMNTAGTVATLRSRKQHSDMQLAANKQQRKGSEAKLTRPPELQSPATGMPVAGPAGGASDAATASH